MSKRFIDFCNEYLDQLVAAFRVFSEENPATAAVAYAFLSLALVVGSVLVAWFLVWNLILGNIPFVREVLGLKKKKKKSKRL